MKRFTTFILSRCLALVLPTVPSLALAGASVDMSTGTFQFTLSDLTPADGLAPAFSIDPLGSFSRVITGASNLNRVELMAPGVWTPLSNADHVTTTAYVAEVGATGLHVGLTEVTPLGLDIGVIAEEHQAISLSPHSRLDVVMPYSWHGDTTPVPMLLSLFLWANLRSSNGSFDEQESILDGHYDRSGLLLGSIINDTDQVVTSGITARLLVNAPVVPEPSTVGLLAIGLGCLALRVRRSLQ